VDHVENSDLEGESVELAALADALRSDAVAVEWTGCCLAYSVRNDLVVGHILAGRNKIAKVHIDSTSSDFPVVVVVVVVDSTIQLVATAFVAVQVAGNSIAVGKLGGSIDATGNVAAAVGDSASVVAARRSESAEEAAVGAGKAAHETATV
jgi:hypothetical protein